MTDTKTLTKQLADLAQLPLSDTQVDQYSEQLGSIMEYMNTIKSLELETTEITARTSDEENVFREDLVEPSFSQEQALQNALASHQGYFLVPRILDKED